MKHLGSRRKWRSVDQEGLFPSNEQSVAGSNDFPSECQIVSVGKRRDGGTRYWCLVHKADATAKYGQRAEACRTAHVPPIGIKDTLSLDIDKYEGVALWGAVPAVYDTTRLPMDRGIHVHARNTAEGEKVIDRTFRAVRILNDRLQMTGIVVTELDAIYYMVSSVFGYQMKHIMCTHCGYSHLDKDWFSVHPHRRHLCAGCGRHFRDTELSIGNPIFGVRNVCGIKTHQPKQSKKKLKIAQADFLGGIQIWGSNPAFIWTSHRAEEEGIHVHAYSSNRNKPELDETFGEVTIDGITLNPLMVRVLMAQSALPSIKNRVLTITCPFCFEPQFSMGELAFTPAINHVCKQCAHEFSPRGRLRKTIANPLCGILIRLADKAPRKPQQHFLDLIPETL